MRQLLTNTFVMIAAMFVAAWILTPAAGPAGKSLDVDAITNKVAAYRDDSESGDGEDMTVIRRDASGHFQLMAQVNGEDIPFLVDTGADMVALTVDDAERLNLDFNPNNFEPIGKTASGIGYGAPVELESLRLGATEFHNVRAVVIDGLETNLLGQSALRQLGKVEIEGNRMVIHHR